MHVIMKNGSKFRSWTIKMQKTYVFWYDEFDRRISASCNDWIFAIFTNVVLVNTIGIWIFAIIVIFIATRLSTDAAIQARIVLARHCKCRTD